MNRGDAGMLRVVFGTLACILAAGCASTRQSAPLAGGAVAAGSARIVLSRPARVVGCAVPIEISDNGVEVGRVGPGGRIAWDRPAGDMVLGAVNRLSQSPSARAEPLRLGVSAGETYLLAVRYPFTGRTPRLALLSGAPAPFTGSPASPRPTSAGGVAPPVATGEARSVESAWRPRGGQYRTLEVKPFALGAGVALTDEFVGAFREGMRQRLRKLRVAAQVVDDGAAVAEADAADSAVVEGTIVGYRRGGGPTVGTVEVEFRAYRRSDHALIVAFQKVLAFKPSPLNTERGVGQFTGIGAAFAVQKALK